MLSRITKYPGTLFLLLMCVAVRLLNDFVPSTTLILAFEARGWTGWGGIVSHMFTHASWDHLIGNFKFGLPFMIYLESRLGSAKMQQYFVLCGITAALFEAILGPPFIVMVGSSGAIFGCAVGACVQFGEKKFDHAVGLLMVSLMLIPQLQYAAEGGGSIAFYAHVGGAVGGMLLSHHFHRAATKP
jgi:membrane associated rhomboid family serine protease